MQHRIASRLAFGLEYSRAESRELEVARVLGISEAFFFFFLRGWRLVASALTTPTCTLCKLGLGVEAWGLQGFKV